MMNGHSRFHDVSNRVQYYFSRSFFPFEHGHERGLQPQKEPKEPSTLISWCCSPAHRGSFPSCGFWFDGAVRQPGYQGRGWTRRDFCLSEGDTRSADSLDTKHDNISPFQPTSVAIPIWALYEDWFAIVLAAEWEVQSADINECCIKHTRLQAWSREERINLFTDMMWLLICI